jgi:hypothetical protein
MTGLGWRGHRQPSRRSQWAEAGGAHGGNGVRAIGLG